MSDLVNAMGGLAGLAALITAIAGLRGIKKDTQALQRGGHDSVPDALAEISERVRSLSRSSEITHELLSDRLDGHDREIKELKKIAEAWQMLS
ncbi:hypothetical protein [Trueperella pyogenes]